jgi:3-dehydroquinate dehydratase-2
MNILLIHGPNLNMLGIREKSVYGEKDIHFVNREIQKEAEKLNIYVDIFQSNHEGAIIDKIHEAMGTPTIAMP